MSSTADLDVAPEVLDATSPEALSPPERERQRGGGGAGGEGGGGEADGGGGGEGFDEFVTKMKGAAIAGVALGASDDSGGDHSWGRCEESWGETWTSGRLTPHISPAQVVLQCQAHLAENEEDAIEWERLAGAYADLYDWHLALQAYHTAMKLRSESNNKSGTPLNAQNLIRVGLIYETLNDFQKARDSYALSASLPGGLIASYMLKDLNERQGTGNEEDTVARDTVADTVSPDTVRDADKEAEEEGRAEDDVEEEEQADGNDSQQRRNERRQQRRERRLQRGAQGLG